MMLRQQLHHECSSSATQHWDIELVEPSFLYMKNVPLSRHSDGNILNLGELYVLLHRLQRDVYSSLENYD